MRKYYKENETKIFKRIQEIKSRNELKPIKKERYTQLELFLMDALEMDLIHPDSYVYLIREIEVAAS